MAPPEIRIGTSGWRYGHWKGVFYPQGLPGAEWLAYYQSRFDTVELNASFYHVPRATTLARWLETSPEDFLWSLKAHRAITHFTRLASREPLEKFLGAAGGLGHGLGVVLFQLPPSLKFDARVAKRFLGWLPKGTRYAVEPRHVTWFSEQALGLLRQHDVALCIADSGGRFPSYECLTAEFVYLRFHGGERLYASRYSKEQMSQWVEKLAAWRRPAFVYFNNDFHGYAAENAAELKQELAQRMRSEKLVRRLTRISLEGALQEGKQARRCHSERASAKNLNR